MRSAFTQAQDAFSVYQAQSPFRRKACTSLFEFTLTHRDSAKEMAEPGVG